MLKLLKSLEKNLLKYGVAAIIMAVPLYPKFPLIPVAGSWVAIRLEDFLILTVTLIWLFSLFRHRFSFFKDSLNRAIIAYLIIGFLSFLSAILITHTVVPHIGLLHTLRRVEYLIVFFIMVSSIKTAADVLFYSKVILLTILAVFLYGIGQKFLGFPVISTMNVEFAKGIALRLAPGARVSSTFAGHYDLGAYMVLLLPLVIASLVGVKKLFYKILLLILFLCSFWLLLVSASRISFAAYLGAITLTLWFLKRRLWIVPVLTLSILASLFTTNLTERYARGAQVALIKIGEVKFTLPWQKQPTVVSFLPPEPSPTPIPTTVAVKPVTPVKLKIEKPTPTPTPSEKNYVFYGTTGGIPAEDRSMSIRFKTEWPRALRALARNPFLGSGFSSITLATDNDYLRALGEVGVLGFLAFLLIFLRIGQRVKRFIFIRGPLNFSQAILIGIVGGILGFLANAFFIDVFEASKVAITFWLLAGLLIGITKLESSLQKA